MQDETPIFDHEFTKSEEVQGRISGWWLKKDQRTSQGQAVRGMSGDHVITPHPVKMREISFVALNLLLLLIPAHRRSRRCRRCRVHRRHTELVIMKIHKRLPPTIARPLATTSSAGPSASRVRSNSSSRSLYTASGSSLPFPFFDAPGTSPPARPGSTNLIVPTRLAAEVKAEVESGQTSQHSQHQNSPHSHSHGANSSGPPPYSLVFSSGNAQSDASSSGHHLQAHYQLMFPNHLPFGIGSGVDGVLGTGNKELENPSKRPRHRYHLDVGAYGIPKHSRKGGRVAGRDGFTPGAGIQCDHASSHAVQVGEDAYFIRENAMGVADGVGGWSKARKAGVYFIPFH